MLKQTMKLWVAVAALGLAGSAQAMTFQLGIQVTSATPGNAIGAVVGTTPNAGTADIGSQVVTGTGLEEPTLNPAAGVGASLALTIGAVLFGGEDDIEGFLYTHVPAMIFEDGVFQGLDYVVLFTISAGEAEGNDLDSSDLSLLTDIPDPLAQFTATQHYWADFLDDGSFFIGDVVGFDQFFDVEDDKFSVGPILGDMLVTGNVFVPEPSLAVLAGTGLVGIAVMRRRRRRRQAESEMA